MKIEVTGPLADADAAWTAVSDTDWLNRVLGNGSVLALELEADPSGGPRIIGALEGVLGTRLGFEEDDNRWVVGRYFRQGRAYDHPLLRRSIYEGRLERRGEGVVPVVSMELQGSPLTLPVVAATLRRMRSRLHGHLHALPPPGGSREVPLRELSPAGVEAWERWRHRTDPELAERVRQHLRTARPLELQRMRAFALADRWQVDRELLLTSLVHSVTDGLFELYWSVRCPRCHGQAASTGHLGDLADHASCASCRIGFGADLGENVEVLFAPHPSMGGRVVETFCSLFPAGAPETQASWILTAGEHVHDEVALSPGVYRLGSGGDQEDVRVVVAPDGASALRWDSAATGELRVRSGAVSVEVTSEARARVQLTRHGLEQADRVLASTLATMPQFRRELGHQVLAPDIRIATRSVTLLFTDLTGSTALYEEVGDARAFAVVRDHFALLRRVCEAHGGVIVKTIGDAIMAAFDEPARALAAAIEMSVSLDAWASTLELAEPPRLCVGLHTGPALMVHTDASGLDYFGRTVNLAARTESAADGGQITWTEAVHGWPSVQRLLTEHGLRPVQIEVQLKGLETTRLYRLDSLDGNSRSSVQTARESRESA